VVLRKREKERESDSSDRWVFSDVVETEWRKRFLVFKVRTTIVRVREEKTVRGAL